LLEYADAYHWVTGQTPSSRTLSDWIQEFWYWQGEGLDAEDIRRAYDKVDFLVVRPGSLTNTAIALKAKGKVGPRCLNLDEGGGIYV
jgi:hypothetical protein